MLNGSSSCTCSVEASCDSNVKLTAIDLRLGTNTTCGQSISIVDGASRHVFDCSHNNDYLPTVLLTSTSHFVQIKIEDNLGVEGGYYFILLEGSHCYVNSQIHAWRPGNICGLSACFRDIS